MIIIAMIRIVVMIIMLCEVDTIDDT